jgi:putative FmdB family regulatory protein
VPVYEFECKDHGVISEVRSMDQASEPCICGECGIQAQRIYGDFLFLEDRCRFARNPRTGSTFSDMLGMEYPQDRRSRDALYKMKGIEPVSTTDMPSQWKTALEYRRYLDSGGKKLPPKQEAELIEKPDLSDIKSIPQMLRESNLKLGI